MKRLTVPLIAIGLVLFACSDRQAGGDVIVFAASSLSDAFEGIAAEFERAHPDVTVVLNLAGSQTLATQILEGAEPDVFASADRDQMARVVAQLRPEASAEVFATNRLSIVVESGNPLGISGLADLSRSDLRVVLGAPEVPVGRYSSEVLERAGVEVESVSEEPNVRSVLTKVALGEADAGIVYQSDAASAADDVDEVTIPASANVVAEYLIVAFDGISAEARALFDFIVSEEGVRHLAKAGFGT